MWTRQLLADLLQPQSGPTTLFCDNAGAIALARDPVEHTKVKHIDIKYHYLRKRVADKDIDIVFVGTDKQAADFLTKSLGRDKLRNCLSLIGMC